MRMAPIPFLFAIAAIVLADTLIPEQTAARHGFLESHHHWQGVCSVMSRHPCTPTVCSVFHRGPCIPEIQYPIGEDLQLTIISSAAGTKTNSAAETRSSDFDEGKPQANHKLNTLREMFNALRACWIPPPEDKARPNMQMSVRFSFKSTGEIMGTPRVTYRSPQASPETTGIYYDAITAALNRCVPLHLTSGLSGAIAGRPIAIRYVDNRKQD